MASILFCFAITMVYFMVGVFMHKATEDKHLFKQIVKLHPSYFVIGIVGTLTFDVFAIIKLMHEEWAFSYLFFSFSLLSCSLIIAYFNCRLFYDESKVVIRNFFRKKTSFSYAEISDVELGIDGILFVGNKKIKIPNYAIGRGDFGEAIKLYVDRILRQKGKMQLYPLPKVIKFRDAVYGWEQFAFGAVVLGGLLGGFCFLVLIINPHWLIFTMFLTCEVFTFFIIYSPKRAHPSKFWAYIASKCYRKGYLKHLPIATNEEE